MTKLQLFDICAPAWNVIAYLPAVHLRTNGNGQRPKYLFKPLALYINSKSARQREILRQRKYPEEEFSLSTYHIELREVISQYLSHGADNTLIIHKRIQSLTQLAPSKIGTQRRTNANIDVLEWFLEMLDQIDFKGGAPLFGKHNPPKLTIHNLPVNVHPDIVLRGDGPKGKKYIGALKLQLSKANAFDSDMAGYVSTILQEYCKIHLASDDEIIHAPYYRVIDVGSMKVFDGVKSVAQRLKDVDAACHNIVALWPSI
jgi:hypothetical protein